MSVIGRFRKSSDEDYSGSIETLLFHVNPVHFVKQAKGANFTICGPDETELGAAWVKEGEYGTYLSVRLDDPALLAPVNAVLSLKPTDDGFYLLRWQRRRENGRGE